MQFKYGYKLMPVYSISERVRLLPRQEGYLGTLYDLGGYVLPGFSNLDPILKRICFQTDILS